MAGGEAAQKLLGGLVVTALVIGGGAEKFGVVIQSIAGAMGLSKAGRGIGVALVEQVGVAEGEVGGGSRVAGVTFGVGGNAVVGGLRAERHELLGHGAQLG